MLLPKEALTYINITRALCKNPSHTIVTPEHIREDHSQQVPTYEEMFECIKELIVHKTKKNSRR